MFLPLFPPHIQFILFNINYSLSKPSSENVIIPSWPKLIILAKIPSVCVSINDADTIGSSFHKITGNECSPKGVSIEE